MSESARTPENVLRRLEWTVIRRLDGLLHGDYRTLFRGAGLDLADLREYQYHDDVRHIDWNVTARLQVPYVREFNEEREVAAWFLLDLSPSVDFGSTRVRKKAVAIDFVAVLARLLTRHGNRVGAMFYGGKVDTVIPVGSGRRHVLHIMHGMSTRPELPGASATDLGELLRTAFQMMRRTFGGVRHFRFHQRARAGRSRSPISRNGTRWWPCGCTTRWRWSFPTSGCWSIQDAETGEQIFVDTHDRGFRKRFAAAAERREAELRTSLRNAGVDALELSTEDDLVDAILRFSDLRKRRSQLAAGATMPQHLVAGA